MRLLKSLTFLSLLALVLAETPNILVRSTRVRQPLIKLAVQPAIAAEPLTVAADAEIPQDVAPVQPDQGMMPFMGPQYWPGYGANNWYGYRPYWGGYGQMRPRRWGRRYWSPRVVVPVEASTVAAVVDTDATANVVVGTDVVVPTDVVAATVEAA